MRFELFSRITLFGKRYYWRLKAKNNRVIAQSEGYRNKVDALSTVHEIRRNSAYAQVENGQ